MKSVFRGLVWVAVIPMLSVASTAGAAVACPAPGTVIYGEYHCSVVSNTSKTNPCRKFVVTSVSSGKASGKYYYNAYYRWVYLYDASFACQ